MNSIFLLAKSVVFVLFLGAITTPCFAAGPLVLKYDAATRDATPKAISQACTINFVSFSDMRNNQENIGHDLKTLVADNVMPWFEQGLFGLKAYGYSTKREASTEKGVLNVEARLTRSYVFQAGPRINSVVAFELLATSPKGQQHLLKIRAFGSKTNMMGADSEFVAAMNYAINNALVKAARRLEEPCNN